MKKFVLIIAVMSLISNAHSQKVIGELSTKNVFSDFRAISFNDSVLISYEETRAGYNDGHRRSMWLKENGIFRYDNFSDDIFYIVQVDDAVYYYSFADAKIPSLKALVEKPGKEGRRSLPSILQFEGKIIGSYYDKNLYLLTFNEDTNQIKVSEINGMKVVSEKRYILPIPFSKLLKKDFQFFNGQSMLNTFMGWAKVRVYRYNKDIYITVDAPYSQTNSKGFETQVFVLKSEDETVQMITFPEVLKDDFRSFILDDKLFRCTISKTLFALNIYDLKSKSLITKKEILPGKESFNVYLRSGSENLINHDETFESLMRYSGPCQPNLVVIQDSSKFYIQWGTYFDEKGIMGVSPTNILGLLVMAVGTTVKQLSDGPGVGRYFYNEWDSGTTEFKINKDPGIARNKIDQYEIEMATKAKFSYKSYIPHGNGVLGLYYQAKKKQVTFVQFD